MNNNSTKKRTSIATLAALGLICTTVQAIENKESNYLDTYADLEQFQIQDRKHHRHHKRRSHRPAGFKESRLGQINQKDMPSEDQEQSLAE